ncbi:MAG: PIG-L family deacetylase [Clostridia bacterium]|nr:PIG-L family deacetylase [Clostridia bacterium]MBQ9252147.1 PIG-L family deacetylase [Clostridia bacterium]
MSLTSIALKFAVPSPRIESFQRYLFIGPHPDDIEIGAGATIAKLIQQGKQVAFLVCLDGRYGDGLSGGITGDNLARLRREESIRAAASLGVKDVYFLGRTAPERFVQACSPEEIDSAEPVCDGGFYDPKDLVHGIADAVIHLQPEIIFGPDPLSRSESHLDHLNTGTAVRQIACFAPYAGIMDRYLNEGRKTGETKAPVQAVAFYMTARPNRFVHTSKALMNRQLQAIREHKSQFPQGSGELSSVQTYLKLRSVDFGLRRCSLHAEGFRVYNATQMHCLPEAGE